MANRLVMAYEYNAMLRNKDIPLRDFIKRFSSKSNTFVKIDESLIHITKVEEEYLDKIVDRLELVPNGGIIHLKEEK